MGYEIGRDYQKINQNRKKDPLFQKEYDLKELVSNQNEKFLACYQEPVKGKAIREIMSEQEITFLVLKLQELTSSFDKEEKVYIHGDIHPKNIMIDRKK